MEKPRKSPFDPLARQKQAALDAAPKAFQMPTIAPGAKSKDVIRAAMEVALAQGTMQGLAQAAGYAKELLPFEVPRLSAVANVTPPPPDSGAKIDVTLLDADDRATLRELLMRASVGVNANVDDVVDNGPQPRAQEVADAGPQGLLTSGRK